METLLLALSPFVVALVSQGVKKLISKKLFTTGFRRSAVRIGVAFLSYGSIIGGAVLTGGQVDPVATETFVQALIIFLSSTGTYFMVKK